MIRRFVILGAALTLLLTAAVAAAGTLPPGGTFSDDNGNIHEANIEAIAAAGITKGCNPPINDRYCPSSTVTRGQMAAFLVRALGLTDRLDNPFWDDDGSVFEADIERLAAAGITKGCNPPTNDRYCPSSPVLRDQMASFLVRALGLTPIVPPPPDSSTSTTSGVTGTTQPAVGPSATFMACGTDDPGEEFSLDQDCVEAAVYNSDWANAFGIDISYRWLDPDGNPVGECPVRGNCVVVNYHYIGSSPIGWSMFFYVDGENRSAGWHTLELWQGVTGDPLQVLLLRDHFELSAIPPVDASTTTTTTTTTLPPQPDVAWECIVEAGGIRSCSGNVDTLDAATESWSCTPTESGYPNDRVPWSCSGDIDKRAAGTETWSCDGWGECSGNIDTSDGAEETWSIDIWGDGQFWGDGDIDKSVVGGESWQCEPSDLGGMHCVWMDYPFVTAWSCDGTLGDQSYGGAWSCSGDVGRRAPIVGPVPVDYVYDYG